MSTYKPIFPACNSPVRQLQSSLSTSTSTAALPQPKYTEQLSRYHAMLAPLPAELCAASCPPSPRSHSRTELLKDQIITAVSAATGDPTHPKWTHVSQLVKMACTSRGYKGAAKGTRVGQSSKADPGDYKWVLPDTEEEWYECERRWAQRSYGSSGVRGSTSKYWQNQASGSKPARPLGAGEQDLSKVDRVRAKVESWKAKVVHVVEDVPVDLPPRRDKSKGKEVIVQTHLLPATPLDAGKVANSVKTPASPARHGSPLDVRMSSSPKAAAPPIPDGPANGADHITDLSEMSFLPPSFPSHLQTSTPQLPVKVKPPASKEKPPPIPFRSSLSSPHLSPQWSRSSFDPSHPRQHAGPLCASSSLPTVSPHKPVKRHRSPSTTSQHGASIDKPKVSRGTPPHKKARRETETTAMPSSGYPPPSTPPTSTDLPHHKAKLNTPPPRPNTGNAPTTPNRQALPNLTDLLASSRKTKTRPRIRKPANSPPQSNPRTVATPAAPPDGLPMLPEAPDPSPTKTNLSSIASGSTDSPNSTRHRPQSPVSPLFSQHPDGFVPPYVSTQRFARAANSLLHADSQRRSGGSGFFAGGFNSQYDVEGQVDRVSELLERDVDFDGWIRDIPEEEGDGRDAQASQGSMKIGY